jgi:hypothetical protein
VLQVEPETKCAICKHEIIEATERLICAVCEKIVRKKCLNVHLEDCVDYQVTFPRKRR